MEWNLDFVEVNNPVFSIELPQKLNVNNCVVGGGNFGSAIDPYAHGARLKAINHSCANESAYVIWVALDAHVTNSINNERKNCKYLPEFGLPPNVT